MVASSKICCYTKHEIVRDVKTNLHHRRRQLKYFLRMKSMTKMMFHNITRVAMFTIVVNYGLVIKILSSQSKFPCTYIQWISIFQKSLNFHKRISLNYTSKEQSFQKFSLFRVSKGNFILFSFDLL